MSLEILGFDKKYRPGSLKDIVGNKSIVDSLKTFKERKEGIPHSFLLVGPSGAGKTTLSRIISSEILDCKESDLREINCSNTRGIDSAREIIVNSHYAPLEGKVKVYILNEVHKSTNEFQNAMLEILEEPPKHVYFILCTTEPEKLLKTIHTRCTTYQTKLLNVKEMNYLLNSVLALEGVLEFPKKVIDEIVRVSEGCPRQALVTLDAVIDIMDDEEALEAVSAVTIGEAEVIDICRGVVNNEPWKTLRVKVKNVLLTSDPEKIRYAILGYLGAILLNSDTGNDRISALIDVFSENTYNSNKAGISNMIFIASTLK